MDRPNHFEHGDLVERNSYIGEVREVIRQIHADDLHVIDWYEDPDDHELYPFSALNLVRFRGCTDAL